jgi:membrane-bound lytic murein transglycosylase D
MLKLIVKSLLLILCLQSSLMFAGTKAGDTTFVYIQDDPIVAMLDSLQRTKYFECNSYLSDSCLFDMANYKTGFIPYFDELVYEARLAKLDEQTPFDLIYNSAVKAYIDMYSLRKRVLVSRLIGLSQIYFPMFEEKLAKYELPLELKYLAIVESALNPNAISKSGAGGLWQFMYPTGKMYGLEVNSYVDDRRDPLKATEAACRYFKYLYGMFGDWQMVLAAYNCGPGTLSKAIRRSGNKKTYWEIRPYLPVETQGYVPAFIAVNYLMNFTKEHNIYPIAAKQSYFYADTVHAKQAFTFEAVSQTIDIPMEDLIFLNPAYKLKRVPGYGNYRHLYLPSNKTGAFINNETAIYTYKKSEELSRDSIMFLAMQTAPAKKYHKVKKGENLQKIASKYQCTTADLKQWNKIKGNAVKTGTKLVVFVPNNNAKVNTQLVKQNVLKTSNDTLTANTDSLKQTVSAVEAAPSMVNSTSNPIQNAKVIYHVIQKGDTLWNITNKYKMGSVDELMRINNLSKDYKLIPGGKIKVVVASN